MKKLLILLITLFPLCLSAQESVVKEHLKIMGTPIEGSIEEMCSKLIKARGLEDLHKDPGYSDAKANRLRGDFWQFNNCNIDVIKLDSKEEVGRVIVNRFNYAPVKKLVDDLIKTYTDKYGTPSRTQDKWYLTYGWILDNGTISIAIGTQTDMFRIVYTDYTECADELNKAKPADDL